MLLDWLAREGWMIVNAWLMATAAGIAVLPLCTRLLRGLPDRGFILARALGLALVAYTLWILTTLHVLTNTPVGIACAGVIVLIVAVIYGISRRNQPLAWRAWWKQHRLALIAAELVFVLVLVGWSAYRSAQNSIFTAEKPMDSALLSAIMQTPTFPPQDPWLSGEAINYYYFGHLLGSTLALAAGIDNLSAYNLWTAMIFALAALCTFGVVYDLVAARRARPRIALVFALLGVIVVNVMSNYEFPLVDLPDQIGAASADYLGFWDVPGRETPRSVSADTSIGTWSWMWWFNASRVIKDRVVPNTYAGDYSDAIDEFPYFSYLQADDHAHVAAIFLSIMVMGLALNLLLQTTQPGVMPTLLYGLLLGSLIFVNPLNYPPGLVLLIGAEGLRRLRAQRRLSGRDWIGIGVFAAALIAISLIAYAPFLVGLESSGVSGLLPNLYQATRLPQLFLAFGALLPLATIYVAVETYRAARRRAAAWGAAILIVLALALGLIGATALLTARELSRSNGDQQYSIVNALTKFPNLDSVLPLIVRFRLDGLPTLILLFALLTLLFALLLRGYRRGRAETFSAMTAPTSFALLLIAVALLLLIVPEFLYLTDLFGIRDFTLFKAHIQAWFFLGIAVSYGLYSLLADHEWKLARPAARIAVGGVSAALIGVGLAYAPAALWTHALWETSRWNVAAAPPLTLNGGASLVTADDYKTLTCLHGLVGQQQVVVASGVWSSSDRYSYFYNAPGLASGRVGALTGLPTLLGWGMHEVNWRGTSIQPMLDERVADVRSLYTSTRLADVWPILWKYDISYIVYGDVERHPDWYGTIGEQKFLDAFPVVCQSGESRIFKVVQ